MQVGIHGNGRLTAIIPTYSANEELTDLALKCAKSLRPQVDELIITEDYPGDYNREFFEIADHYLLHKENLGYGKNSNVAWRIASGDFVIHANSDTELIEGSLGDLCVPDTVTSPRLVEQNATPGILSGAFFCVGRNVWEKLGIFDPFNNFSGADYNLFSRYLQEFKSLYVASVVVTHQAGTPGPSRRFAGKY